MEQGYRIRPATATDLHRIVAIFNAQVPEQATVEEFERQDRLRRPEDHFLRLVAVDADDQVVAWAQGLGGPLMKPGEFRVQVRVDQPHRGRGIGAELYQQVERWAAEHGARRLNASVREDLPEALAWATRRGYVKEYHLFESTLSLPDWDPTPFLGAVEQVKAQGIRFFSLADLPDWKGDETLKRYMRFGYELSRDIPGAEGYPKPPLDLMRRYIEEDPHFDPHACILAADGDLWAAMCEMHRRPSGAYYNGFTGVHREYRGRGLSLAIKVVGLLYAREQGAPYIRTHNHSINQPMLATNRRLGYVPEPGVFTVYKMLQA